MHELLKRYIQLNIPVSTENLDEIVKHFKPITAKKNAVLFSQGDTCNKLYFINQGCIRTYYITEQGQEKTRFIAFAGMVATSLTSFISHSSVI